MCYELYGIFLYPINDAPFPGVMFLPSISATAPVSFTIVYHIVTHLVAFICIYVTAKLAVS